MTNRPEWGAGRGQTIPKHKPRQPLDPDAQADRDGVRALAFAMESKLAAKRAEGYGGWNRPDECTVDHLARLLLDHLPKGDPVDVANFCMMLFNREGGADALRRAAAQSEG